MYYHFEFDNEFMVEDHPFEVGNILSDNCNQKVEALIKDRKNGFSFEVKPFLQLNLLSDIKKLEDFSCEFTLHNFFNFFNQTKRII